MIPWNEVTAVFGGTFDPPHLGHRQVVSDLLAFVRRVVVVPSGIPPLKSSQVSSQDRLEMARRNFSGLSQVEVSSLEVEATEKKNSSLPNYTYHTLKELSRSTSPLAFVLGTDQVADFPKWYRFPEILRLCSWIVFLRKPFTVDPLQKLLSPFESSGILRRKTDTSWSIPGSSNELICRETSAEEISSTQIRESIARSGIAPQESLHVSVIEFLKEKKLYGIQ